ncbi:apolipoprotein A-I-binding protein precursor [Cryptosporidium ubiquitum]|uniref:NAD(P)H-hydrate epimerase n=1 Tax=Cryptosporidium ubiquitum TaxID=857276 RepID=A0A1J4MFP9_9CRYT|nr:apolipoprotein A-I-binding protein precursor [Cryptosporidium ubiquitum]OII73090.1 apolipoprotein A-I-binding protein precursor [Cryptosporidium ubiquitum]
MNKQIYLLSQSDSNKLDKELLSENFGYKLDQLMEIAGFNCSSCILHCINNNFLSKFGIHSIKESSKSKPITIFCGPGNNGGDGLVIARYLKLFGGFPIVIYPKIGRPEFFNSLILLLEKFEVPIFRKLEDAQNVDNSILLIDAVFGFGYNSNKTDNCYSEIMNFLIINSKEHKIPVISIDVPSGWEIDMKESYSEDRIEPHVLISLTAPKSCSKYFNGIHFIASLFATRDILYKYKVEYIYDLFLKENATQFILFNQKNVASTFS